MYFIKTILTTMQGIDQWDWAAHGQPGWGATEEVEGIDDSGLGEDGAGEYGSKCLDMREI